MNPELVDMKRRFWISVALTLPILAFMVSELIPGDPLLHAHGMRASSGGASRIAAKREQAKAH